MIDLPPVFVDSRDGDTACEYVVLPIEQVPVAAGDFWLAWLGAWES
jgi:hypothetical protein